MTDNAAPAPDGFEEISAADLATQMLTQAARIHAMEDPAAAGMATSMMFSSLMRTVVNNSPENVATILFSVLIIAADGFNALTQRDAGQDVASVVGASAAMVQARAASLPCTCGHCEVPGE